MVGGALALSSTAVVLRVLRDLGRTLTQLGRVAIAILLVQDVAVGPLLVLTKALGPAAGSLAQALLIAFAKGSLVLLVVVLVARFALRPVFAFVAALDADEVFTATALLLVLGASFATEQAGLSMALGAFVAGLMVADTEYRHQVAADIGRFRGLLLGFFFMTVGMTVDAGFALSHSVRWWRSRRAVAAEGPAPVRLAIGARLHRPAGRRARRAARPGQRVRLRADGARRRQRPGPGATVQIADLAMALSMAVTPVVATLGRGFLDRWRAAPPPRWRSWRPRPRTCATTSW